MEAFYGSVLPACAGPNDPRERRYNFDSEEANMAVNWSKDIDQTFAAAKEQSRPILLDFSAAPA